MDTKTQTTIRTKKLGVLIRDARLSARRSVQDCAEALASGRVCSALMRRANGRRPCPNWKPWSFYLDLPLDRFWSKEIKSTSTSPIKNIDLSKLLAIRQRKIGALLRQERMNASISIRNLANKTGIAGRASKL
jgi:hypothetical protein